MDGAANFRLFFRRSVLRYSSQCISGMRSIFNWITPSRKRKVVCRNVLPGIGCQLATIGLVLTLYFFFTWPPCLWCSSCSCFSWCLA